MMSTGNLYGLICQGRVSGWKRAGRTFIDLETIDAYNAQEFVPITSKERSKASRGNPGIRTPAGPEP
jgi:hypothetical protein